MDPSLGNPDAMRQAAAALGAKAEALAALAQQLDGRAQTVAFEGPAAVEFRAGMTQKRRRAEQLASELQEIANTIVRAAAQVEQQQLEAIQQSQAESFD